MRGGDTFLYNASWRFLEPENLGTFFITSTPAGDRKSTRLNSSHLVISYAVFCLKKKNILIEATSGYSALNTLTVVHQRPPRPESPLWPMAVTAGDPARSVIARSTPLLQLLVQR